MAKVKEVVDRNIRRELEENLPEVIEFLSKALDDIPEQYRKSARLTFDTYYDTLEVELSYERDETAAERAAREEREARLNAKQEDMDKALWARLKAKYGE